jgi:trimeric autotransporter adhesin
MELPEVTRQASVIIYNLEGKQLKNIKVNDRGAAAVKISGSEFNPGMYLYALVADGKVVDTKRLILTK